MQTIYADYKKVNTAGGTCVAIGNFDGVHKGHKKMLSVLKETAKNLGMPSVVYTFSGHPVNILSGEFTQGIIYDNIIKEKLIAEEKIHTLFFEDFLSVKDLSPEEFVKEVLLDKLNLKTIVIGKNGKFGKNGQGNAETLKELGENYGFSVVVVEPLVIGGEICSSSAIREEIEKGNVDKAKDFLGRQYTVSGIVVEDKKLGRTYGYPTANIIPEKYAPRLKKGVYATNVYIDSIKLCGITNVGTTSFDTEEYDRIETYILDFNSDIYGKTIAVEFLYYMRDFMSFVSTEELKTQLDEDRKERKLGGR